MSNSFRTGTRTRAREEQPRPLADIANDCRAKIAELDSEIAAAPTKREAKALRRRRNLCRDLVRWCETRVGYVVDLGKGGEQ